MRGSSLHHLYLYFHARHTPMAVAINPNAPMTIPMMPPVLSPLSLLWLLALAMLLPEDTGGRVEVVELLLDDEELCDCEVWVGVEVWDEKFTGLSLLNGDSSSKDLKWPPACQHHPTIRDVRPVPFFQAVPSNGALQKRQRPFESR